MAELQVHVAGSSIDMLQGQRQHFRLMVRVASARDSRRLDFIKPAVSDAFVVRLTSSPDTHVQLHVFAFHTAVECAGAHLQIGPE